MKILSKRKLRLELYKRLLNYTCAHPQCRSGASIEAHHVRPLSKGGRDAFWNIISLCWHCHHKRKLHSRSEEKMIELYTYKSMHELKNLGFIFDEQEESFRENYKLAVRNSRYVDREDKECWGDLTNVNANI